MERIEPLNRIALELGPFTVYWYGVIIMSGAVLGFYLATKEASRLNVDKDLLSDLIIWALPISIIFARIYYVTFEWDIYSQNPSEIIAIWNGGIAIHGALIGAVITAVIFTRLKHISFWKIADILAPSILLGQAIGRWGNFMNQEAHGGPVARNFLESLFLPDWIIDQMYIEGSYYHPTFLYESSWNLIGFLILIFIRRTNLRRGELFLAYVIWYSFGRFFIEGMRTDSLMLTDNLRVAQVISILLIFLSIFIIMYRRKIGLANKRYDE